MESNKVVWRSVVLPKGSSETLWFNRYYKKIKKLYKDCKIRCVPKPHRITDARGRTTSYWAVGKESHSISVSGEADRVNRAIARILRYIERVSPGYVQAQLELEVQDSIENLLDVSENLWKYVEKAVDAQLVGGTHGNVPVIYVVTRKSSEIFTHARLVHYLMSLRLFTRTLEASPRLTRDRFPMIRDYIIEYCNSVVIDGDLLTFSVSKRNYARVRRILARYIELPEDFPHPVTGKDSFVILELLGNYSRFRNIPLMPKSLLRSPHK